MKWNARVYVQREMLFAVCDGGEYVRCRRVMRWRGTLDVGSGVIVEGFLVIEMLDGRSQLGRSRTNGQRWWCPNQVRADLEISERAGQDEAVHNIPG